MSELLRFLIPFLLILCAAAAQGATHGRPGTVLEPTAEMPLRWPLPEGWMATPLRAEGDHLVGYISGTDSDKWARVYSWPVTRPSDTVMEARRRVLTTLAPSMRLSSSLSRGGLVEFTCIGWSGSSSPRENRGPPDVVAFGRAARVGKRLVAAYLLVRPGKGGKALEDEARSILGALAFQDAREHDVITGYGSIWRPPTPAVQPVRRVTHVSL